MGSSPDLVLLEFSSQSLIAPMSLTNPSIGNTTSTSSWRVVLALMSDMTPEGALTGRPPWGSDAPLATMILQLVKGVQRSPSPRPPRRGTGPRWRRGRGTGRSGAPQPRAPRGRELHPPVERRIAAADDDDALAAEAFGVGDDVVDPAAVPRLGAHLRQPPRRKRADPGGDDDGTGGKRSVSVTSMKIPSALFEAGHALGEVRSAGRTAPPARATAAPAPWPEPWKSRDVEDVLLGVQRGELAPQLGQGVDDSRRRAAHASIEQREQAGGTPADDGDVANFVDHR